MDVHKPWRKNLYENQDYPDNYTDESFLKELQVNPQFTPVRLWEGVLGASLVVQEICTVTAFSIIYVYLYNGWIEPNLLFYWSSGLTACGFVIYRVFYSCGIRTILGHDLRTVLIFIVFGQLFSPVLYTLTDTISTDTIYTMTFFMMLVHLIFFEYEVPSAISSNSLSLSAAVFASICLSSRLASPHQAFVLMTISIKCFVLFPLLRSKMSTSLSVTMILCVLIMSVLYTISGLMAILFISGVIFVNVFCPLLFTKYQMYKDNIYGPWDEAIPQGIYRETE